MRRNMRAATKKKKKNCFLPVLLFKKIRNILFAKSILSTAIHRFSVNNCLKTFPLQLNSFIDLLIFFYLYFA